MYKSVERFPNFRIVLILLQKILISAETSKNLSV